MAYRKNWYRPKEPTAKPKPNKKKRRAADVLRDIEETTRKLAEREVAYAAEDKRDAEREAEQTAEREAKVERKKPERERRVQQLEEAIFEIKEDPRNRQPALIAFILSLLDLVFGFDSIPSYDNKYIDPKYCDKYYKYSDEALGNIRKLATEINQIPRDESDELYGGSTREHWERKKSARGGSIRRLANRLKRIREEYSEALAYDKMYGHIVEKQQAIGEKHQGIVEKQRAFIAAATGKTRDLADSIKQNLSKKHHCPYCGGSLGKTPHADHIYPVSKGGHSTLQNMVNVCAGCNIKKSDQTLATFIRQNGLDRAEIEARLLSLGKEF